MLKYVGLGLVIALAACAPVKIDEKSRLIYAIDKSCKDFNKSLALLIDKRKTGDLSKEAIAKADLEIKKATPICGDANNSSITPQNISTVQGATNSINELIKD